MAILSFPAVDPDTQQFGIKYNTQISSSEISGITQTVELPGARWAGSLSFTDMSKAESALLKVFLLNLRGSSGRFFYGDTSHKNPFNAVTGTPTIESGSTPRLITVTLGSSSPVLSAGDYIQVGNDDARELKMVLSSAVVSGDTHQLTIEPMIRRTDYVGLSVGYSNAKGVFLLTSSDQANWGIRSKALLSDMNIEFIEVFS